MYLWESFLHGNIFFTKKQRSVLYYYKNPKPSEIKIHTIYPNSGTLGLWKFSNLTFEEYLAGTTPVLSVRSSSSLLCRSCVRHVRTVWLIDDFLALSQMKHKLKYKNNSVTFEKPNREWFVRIIKKRHDRDNKRQKRRRKEWDRSAQWVFDMQNFLARESPAFQSVELEFYLVIIVILFFITIIILKQTLKTFEREKIWF